MKTPARNKTRRKPAVRKISSKNKTKNAVLSELITTAPLLVDPRIAHARVSAWLASLAPGKEKLLKTLLTAKPVVNTLFASLTENSPFLWELASREPDRLLRLLQTNPEEQFVSLLADHGHRASASTR